MFFDLSLEDLWLYKPDRYEPHDFLLFWKNTLTEASEVDLDVKFTPMDMGLKLVSTLDVRFSGFGGQTIKGWFILPKIVEEKIPCIVEYIGYGGGRGFPSDWLFFPNAGYALFVMDTRGQGSAWMKGDTSDQFEGATNPHFPGFMTMGVLDPQTYYYRRLFTDAVRAVEAARAHPQVDPDRMAVTGGSQGGGVALAVAGLVNHLSAVMPDVPFLCNFYRAVTITDEKPYGEITAYLKTHRDQEAIVFRTLSYFDGMNFAARAKAPALFSVGLMDTICPPSTVFAAYNHYAGEKEMRVYKFNMHEGGASYQDIEKLKFLDRIWK